MLTPAEQALELAMSRLSPPPEQVSRKRTHEQINEETLSPMRKLLPHHRLDCWCLCLAM
jgi:hypothetical protein